MSKIFFVAFWVATSIAWSVTSYGDDKTDLNKLLNEFLAFDSSNALERHSRFWAEDLVYTSSAGKRFGKAEIISGIKKDNADKQDQKKSTNTDVDKYHAEDVDIRVFGETAIIAFRLVHTAIGNKTKSNNYYFNTGTFLKREGRWQAVAWQATKIPTEEKSTP